MKKIFHILISLLTLNCYGQTKIGSYSIDNNIQVKIDKNVTSFNDPALGSSVIGSVDLKLFIKDSLITDTYSKDKKLECIIYTTLDGDTANITGFVGMFAGFGFQISLFKDSCLIHYISKSDSKIYKLKKTDSLNYAIAVPCKTSKLTLTNKPVIKKGEVISGIIELTSDDYYEVANGKETKYRMQLTGYFKTEALQSLQDKYNKLKPKKTKKK